MVERLNGLDTGMLAGETPEWHMHAGALALLEPMDGHDLDVAGGIRAVLNARRGLLGPFRYRLLEAPLGPRALGLGRSADLDLGTQVRRVGVPAPGGMREVAALVGDLFSSPLSRGGPLWEIWVLEGLESGHVGILMKVHHALMDGIRGERLLEVLFDLEPDAPLARPRRRSRSRPTVIRRVWACSSDRACSSPAPRCVPCVSAPSWCPREAGSHACWRRRTGAPRRCRSELRAPR